jgi:ATP-dependent exoDNAse (exonuclease V) beta subunit
MSRDLTIVPAGAGSGKTYRIETTLSKWLQDGAIKADRILAVTFTEAAASDMKARIRSRLLQDGRTEDALALDRAYVGTIHALGQRILTEHAFAAGNAPTSRLLDETERDLLIREQIARSSALRPVAENLGRFGYQFGNAGSAEDQFRGTVLSLINILSGLGARATDAGLIDDLVQDLTNDYGKPGDDKALHAALKSAAQNMISTFPKNVSENVTAKGPKASLRGDHKLVQRAATTDILTTDWSAWQKLRNLFVSNRNSKTPDRYDDLAEKIIAAADSIEQHPGPLNDAIAHITALVHGAQEILAAYEAEKRARCLIDYADMIAGTEAVLRENPDTLSAVLDEVDCVVIDEFQDTNPVQFALLWRLAQNAPKALIVGDRKQAIMGFQGADPRLSAALDAQHHDALDPLDCNWRSVPEIMHFVNALGRGVFGDDYDPLTPQVSPASGPALSVLNLDGKLDHKFQCIAEYIDEILASDRQIRRGSDGPYRDIEPSDVAVLVYTKGHAQKMADALRAYGLPVRLLESGWYDSLIVDLARAALAYAANPADKFAAINLGTRGPDRLDLALAFHGVKDDTIDATQVLKDLKSLSPSLVTLPVADALQQVLRASGLWDWAKRLPNFDQASADLKRLILEAQTFDSAPTGLREAAGFYGASIDVFLGWLWDLVDRSDDTHPDPSGWTTPGIEISTWHSSKGREWPVTIVAGWDKDIRDRPHTIRAEFSGFDDLNDVLARAKLSWHAPFAASGQKEKQALKQQGADEEAAARAIYVALTRARETLVLALPKAPAADKDRPATMYDLQIERTGFAQTTGEISLGEQSFEAKIHTYAKDYQLDPTSEEQATQTQSFGVLNTDFPNTPLTLWRSSPSTLDTAKSATPIAEHFEYSEALPKATTDMTAAERGTVCHLAFRVMFERPEAKTRLMATIALEEAEINALERQAGALRQFLGDLGYEDFHLELPLQQQNENGAEMNAIIDLLAVGDHGIAIIDHKTGTCSDLQNGLAGYWPQLSSYQDLAAKQWPDKPVTHIAINWMDEGKISLITIPAMASAAS